MKDLDTERLPVMDASELLEVQYKTHQHIHSYLMVSGRDPILFELADMMLLNAELLIRILRNLDPLTRG